MTAPTSITLKPKQTYSDYTNGMTITGSAGNETVIILPKIGDANIANVGIVKLTGKIADYTIHADGDKLVISANASSATPIATVSPAEQGTILMFGDGSKASLTLDQGTASYHYDVVQMAANATLTVADNDVSIRGSTGTEAVKLDVGLRNVVVDSKVEKIAVNVDLGSLTLSGIKAGVSIANGDGTKIADLYLARGHGEILAFDNGSGTLTMDSAGKGAFTLTAISLQAGDVYAATTSGITITAAAPSDSTTVALGAGVNKEHIGAAIGQVKFAGKFSDYTYQNKSGVLYVFDKTGKTAIADIQLQQDANGTDLAYADGTNLSATINSGGIKIGASSVATLKPAIITLPLPGSPVADSATPSSFNYSLTLGNFGAYQSAIQTDVNTAIGNIGKYLVAQGVFNVQVVPDSSSPGIIASASGTLMATPSTLLATEHGANSITTFQLTSLTGTDPNPGKFDAVVKINMANLARLNLDPNTLPSSSQIDLTTALTHEMIHAIGFQGYTGFATSTKTAFDTYISMQAGKPYFVGPSAQAVYGGPVPLAPASAGPGSAYFHVDVPGDLMATSLSYGQVRAVSTLDLAILKDIGIPEVAIVGTPPLQG